MVDVYVHWQRIKAACSEMYKAITNSPGELHCSIQLPRGTVVLKYAPLR